MQQFPGAFPDEDFLAGNGVMFVHGSLPFFALAGFSF